MTPRRALWCLIVASAALRMAWAGSVGLGHDEAYHYLFATHPSWSYFDHPPMLALVESLGLGMTGSASPLALRLGFVLLFAGSTWLLAGLTARFFGEWAGFFAAFAMNVSAYHTAAAGAFALPDGPLLFFWLLTLDRMASAVEEPDRIGRWVVVGLAWGGALLSKYHAVFLPVGLVAYLAIDRPARSILRRPGPYLATLVGLAAFAPVIYWNATHHWASFAFQGARAVAKPGFRPLTMLAAIVGQAAYLLPWIWLALLYAIGRSVRSLARGEASFGEKFLLSQSLTPLALFTAVSCIRDVLPHWTLVGYLSAYPLLGRLWATRAEADPARLRRRLAAMAAVPVAVAAILVAQYRTGVLPIDRLIPPRQGAGRIDPTSELYGWDQLAEELGRRGLLGPGGPFLFTSMWYDSGHLGYATRGSGAPIVCYHPNDARSFAFWSRPDDWVGRDGLLVTMEDRWLEPACYERWFERIEPAGTVPVVRAGEVVRTFRLYRCVRQVSPFPYDYDGGPRRAPRSAVAGGEHREARAVR